MSFGGGSRALTVLLAAALVAPAAAAGASERIGDAACPHWRPHLRDAIAYARTRAGTVRLSVRAGGRAWGWRATSSVPSASVLKAMLLVAYLNDPRVRGRALTPHDHALLGPMIRWSDNATASAVLGFVGADAVQALARRAGMRRFVLDPVVWGASRIDADDQTRFFRWIDRRVPRRHRAAAMHLLATVVPQQRWGIGALRLRGWRLYFKGGWGSGTGAVEHQVALLRRGERRVAVAVLTTGSPSHVYAAETLRNVFARLLRGLAG